MTLNFIVFNNDEIYWVASKLYICIDQCWTVGAIITFGRSRMFGPDKLWSSTVGCSQSRRIKKV